MADRPGQEYIVKIDDAPLRPDAAKLESLSAAVAWMNDPKYFNKVRIASSAAIKMMTHAATGVEKGLAAANGLPVEVMGLLHGHIDTENEKTLVVTDAFPLPVEGTETSVVADDEAGLAYRTALDENLEKIRGGVPFVGWYHSHPFDVGPHSNAFLSATDVGTQTAYQNAVDSRGIPFLSLVVDPLRGIAKSRPEIGAFRCYPPAYTPPKGTAPDGTVWADEKARNARWGESCISYYQLDVEYFVPALASSILSMVAKDFMWTRILSSTPMLEAESRDRLPARLKKAHAAVDTAALNARSVVSAFTNAITVSSSFADASKKSADIAFDLCQGQAAQAVKTVIFNATTSPES